MLRTIEMLHKGVCSEIWSAYRPDLETNHVLKVLSAVGSNESSRWDYERLFYNEAKVLARLAHPSIIRFYDIFEDASGQPVILLEDGGVPLSSIPAEAITLEALGAISIKILSAIQYLQRPIEIGGSFFESVVHGDIKPENILISKGGAKLIDFGASCIPDDLHARAIVGTPKYLGPWRKPGQKLTWRDDLYALGVTMGELAAKSSSGDSTGGKLLNIFKYLHEFAGIQDAIDGVFECLYIVSGSRQIRMSANSRSRGEEPVRDLSGLISSLINSSQMRGSSFPIVNREVSNESV